MKRFVMTAVVAVFFAWPTAAPAQTEGNPAVIESAAPPSAPPPAQVAASAAPVSSSEETTCGKAGLKRVADAARQGTVRVTTHTRWGAGFLIDDTHVVTHYSVVERPLTLRVHARDGLSIGAKVVFVDAFERIAILELDAPMSGKALELAASAPAIGSEVVAIGIPVDFGTRESQFPAHRRGIVSDRNDELMTTDALVGNTHYMGGPLLDCQGHVTGILIPPPSGRAAWEDPMGHAVPVGKIREARANAEKKPFHPRPSFSLGFQTALAGQIESKQGLIGGTIAIPIVFAEQWEFVPRFGAFAQLPPANSGALSLGWTDNGRFTGDVHIGYRIPLVEAPMTVALVPYVGAGWNWDLTRSKTYDLTLQDPTCIGQMAPCSLQATGHEQKSWQRMDVLSVGLDLRVNAMKLGYELRIVPGSDVKFIHQISFGVATF